MYKPTFSYGLHKNAPNADEIVEKFKLNFKSLSLAEVDEEVFGTLRKKQRVHTQIMEGIRMKTRKPRINSKQPINKDAVTIADLEREIADLRLGLRNQTELLSTIQKENIELRASYRRAKDDLREMRDNLEAATRDVIRQQQFQTRAHETIERLSKVMEAMVTTSVTVDSCPMQGSI